MKKGFSTFEFLTLIVGLAIIVIIAIPVTLKVRSITLESNLVSTANTYVEAINLAKDSSNLQNGEYTTNEFVVDVMKMPTSGIITIEDSFVTDATLCIDGYLLKYSNNSSIIISSNCN